MSEFTNGDVIALVGMVVVIAVLVFGHLRAVRLERERRQAYEAAAQRFREGRRQRIADARLVEQRRGGV